MLTGSENERSSMCVCVCVWVCYMYINNRALKKEKVVRVPTYLPKGGFQRTFKSVNQSVSQSINLIINQ